MKRILFGSFLVVLILLSFFSYLFIDPNFVYLQNLYTGFAFSNRLVTVVFYLLLVSALFILFYLFLKKSSQFSFSGLTKLLAVGSLILLFAYPAMLSYDIFNYSTTARVLFHYQENPYIIMPIAFPDEPFLQYTRAANKIALYGPVWLGLTGIPFLLGFNSLLLILFNLKLLVSAFYFGTLYLIWHITKSKKAVMLFGLNPLILIQTLLSGHNDIVMMFFALASYVFVFRKQYILGMLFLLLSIFIKYATIVLVPIVLYLIFATVTKRKINFEKVYLTSAVVMLVMFLLSAFREEIYPWYATWFLVFTALLPDKKYLQTLVFVSSFSLLLRDLPYMMTGNYFGSTPILRTILTFVPVTLAAVVLFLKQKRYLR